MHAPSVRLGHAVQDWMQQDVDPDGALVGKWVHDSRDVGWNQLAANQHGSTREEILKLEKAGQAV